MSMDHIKKIDECGNVDGHSGNALIAGEMIKNQEVPKGCTLYTDPCNSPIYGSSATNAVEPVSEKYFKD